MYTNEDEIVKKKAELMSQKIDKTIDNCVNSIYNLAKSAVLPDDPWLQNKTLNEATIETCLPNKQEIRKYLEDKVYDCIENVVTLTILKKLC